MKKLLTIILLLGLLILPLISEEQPKPKYKVPDIKVIAIYSDINAMAFCVDGEVWIVIYGAGIIETHKKCELENKKDI